MSNEIWQANTQELWSRGRYNEIYSCSPKRPDQLAAIYRDVMCGDLFELQNIAFDLKSSEYAAFPAFLDFEPLQIWRALMMFLSSD